MILLQTFQIFVREANKIETCNEKKKKKQKDKKIITGIRTW